MIFDSSGGGCNKGHLWGAPLACAGGEGTLLDGALTSVPGSEPVKTMFFAFDTLALRAPLGRSEAKRLCFFFFFFFLKFRYESPCPTIRTFGSIDRRRKRLSHGSEIDSTTVRNFSLRWLRIRLKEFWASRWIQKSTWGQRIAAPRRFNSARALPRALPPALPTPSSDASQLPSTCSRARQVCRAWPPLLAVLQLCFTSSASR